MNNVRLKLFVVFFCFYTNRNLTYLLFINNYCQLTNRSDQLMFAK